MRFTITEQLQLAGQRLDKALAHVLPEASLRHRRRLIEQGRVLVDGSACSPGFRLFAGQVVEITPDEPTSETVTPEQLGVGVLRREGAFAAVSKPAGVHSADLRGSGGVNLERLLLDLFPGESPVLLNRLDQGTSGFVLVGFSPEAVDSFRELERVGKVCKEYLALVQGEVREVMVLKNRLDMADRKRVRVLAEADPDPARHTKIEPLEPALDANSSPGTTFVRAIIARGARHQIRAHLAAAGHPIVGDALYGTAGERLCLYHTALDFPGFSVRLDPDR